MHVKINKSLKEVKKGSSDSIDTKRREVHVESELTKISTRLQKANLSVVLVQMFILHPAAKLLSPPSLPILQILPTQQMLDLRNLHTCFFARWYALGFFFLATKKKKKEKR